MKKVEAAHSVRYNILNPLWTKQDTSIRTHHCAKKHSLGAGVNRCHPAPQTENSLYFGVGRCHFGDIIFHFPLWPPCPVPIPSSSATFLFKVLDSAFPFHSLHYLSGPSSTGLAHQRSLLTNIPSFFRCIPQMEDRWRLPPHTNFFNAIPCWGTISGCPRAAGQSPSSQPWQTGASLYILALTYFSRH